MHRATAAGVRVKTPGRAVIELAREILEGAYAITSFSGAGLSAESGVPTFRDAQSGGEGALWEKFDPMTLASPEGFGRDPEMVMDWYGWRRRAIAQAKPNPAHRALAARDDITHVTQNVDDLLEQSGAANVIHLHGSIARDRCHELCGFDEAIDLTDPPALRSCPQCGAPVRPGVVWFGEALPADAWSRAEQACTECDVMLVVGTSAAVYPAAGLIALARGCGARIIIVNTQPSDASDLADAELLGPAGEVLPALLGV